MTETKEQLIAWYEGQLEKVKVAYRTDTHSTVQNERNGEYVKSAEEELEAVKNGRGW